MVGRGGGSGYGFKLRLCGFTVEGLARFSEFSGLAFKYIMATYSGVTWVL